MNVRIICVQVYSCSYVSMPEYICTLCWAVYVCTSVSSVYAIKHSKPTMMNLFFCFVLVQPHTCCVLFKGIVSNVVALLLFFCQRD